MDNKEKTNEDFTQKEINPEEIEHNYTVGELRVAMEALGMDKEEPLAITPAQKEVFIKFMLSIRTANGIKPGKLEEKDMINTGLLTDIFSGVAAFLMDVDKMALFLLPRTRNEILDRLTDEQIAERAQRPKEAKAAKDSGETPSLYEFFLYLGFLFACERLKALPKDLLRKLKKEGSKDFGPFSMAPNSKALIKINHILAGGGRDMGRTRSFEEMKHELTNFTNDKGEKIQRATTTYINNKSNEKIVLSIDRAIKEGQEGNKRGPRTEKKKAKIEALFWQQYVNRGHPGEVKLFYDDLEQLGICTSRKYAIEALDSFAEWFEMSSQRASYYKAPKQGKSREKYMGGDRLITGTRRIMGGWVFKINADAAIYEIYARDYTVFPNFGYRLSDNAFFILRYLFYMGGTNAAQLRESEGKPAPKVISFSLPFDALRTAAGLLPPEEVHKRNYSEKIKKPIIEALEEIQREAKREKMGDAIILEYDEEQETNIEIWLDKRLKVTLAGEVAKAFKTSIVRGRKKIKKTDGGEDPKRKDL